MKKALVILFDKAEELEAIAPVDILRRARVDVTTAALGDSLEIIGRSGIAIDADEPFAEACKKNFDAVFSTCTPTTSPPCAGFSNAI